MDKAEKLLRDTLIMLQNCSVESGVCCCGDDMDKHGMAADHTPVDQGAQFAGQLETEIKEYLNGLA